MHTLKKYAPDNKFLEDLYKLQGNFSDIKKTQILLKVKLEDLQRLD